MKKQFAHITSIGLILYCCLQTGLRAEVQQKQFQPASNKELTSKKLSIHFKQTGFQAAISELSRQLGLQVLADGTPLVQAIDLNFEGSATEGIELLLSKFDYKWRLFKGKTLILTKAFNSPDERPQFIEAEIRKSVEDAVKLAKTLPPSDKMFSESLGDLFNALPEFQKQTLMSGGKVAMRDMPLICKDILAATNRRSLLDSPVTLGDEVLRIFHFLKTAEFKVMRIPVQFDLAGKDMGWAKGLVIDLKTPLSEPHSILALTKPIRNKENER